MIIYITCTYRYDVHTVCTYIISILIHPYIPAVDHHGAPFLRVVLVYPLAEVEEGGGVLGNPMVRPLEEVELLHLPHWHLGNALSCQLHEGVREYVSVRV